MEREVIVLEVDSGLRLDKYLTSAFELNRAKAQDLIAEGKVAINQKVQKKASLKVAIGDIVSLILPEKEVVEPLEIEPEAIPLDILYEDDDIIVLNKERGMVVYPTKTSPKGTLVNALLYHTKALSDLSGHDRPGIVHRLDKDTSGLMVIAKTNDAHESLVAGFKVHAFERHYLGIVHGIPKNRQAKIDLPIARDKAYRTRMAVSEAGKKALTHYKVCSENEAYALLQFSLETGRTHQIRVHMKYLKCPLYGDRVYGKKNDKLLDGQALHAYKLIITHPRTGEKLIFEKEAPYFIELCQALNLKYLKGDEEFVK